jgi:hypothetical protein
MVTGIAIAGSVGITLLWILDVLVYHDLLIRYHVAGQHLEKVFDWLPPVRTHFDVEAPFLAVRTYVGLFYVLGILVLCCGTMIILGISRLLTWSHFYVLTFFTIMLLVVIVGLTQRVLWWKRGLTPWITP